MALSVSRIVYLALLYLPCQASEDGMKKSQRFDAGAKGADRGSRRRVIILQGIA
jgi:hypothetical protein